MRKPTQSDISKGPVKCRFKHAASNIWVEGLLRSIDADRSAKHRYFCQSSTTGKTGWSSEAEVEDVEHDGSCQCAICLAESRVTGFIDESLDYVEQAELIGRQIERLIREHIKDAASLASVFQTHIIMGVAAGTCNAMEDGLK